jgi:hypothetical protein
MGAVIMQFLRRRSKPASRSWAFQRCRPRVETLKTHVALGMFVLLPGIQVQVHRTVVTPRASDSQSFVFEDGRIAVQAEAPGYSLWSSNAGRSWETRQPDGPAMGGFKMAIQLSASEILNMHRTPREGSGGRWMIGQQRSTNNWESRQEEQAIVSGMPALGVMYADDCEYVNGKLKPGRLENAPFLMHHGMLRLKDGRILATGYAVLQGDTRVVEGYDPNCRTNKSRAFVLTSNDTKGTSWGNFVQVAHDKALNAEGQVVDALNTPGIAGEGFNESDLARAPNRDIIMVMRTGGDHSTWRPRLTPMYMSRSSDEGKTWTIPAPIADFGSNPNIVTLDNGVMGVIYGGNGTWMKFSHDSGYTWQGPLQLSRSSTYPDLHALDSDNFLAFYYNADLNDWAMTVIEARPSAGAGAPLDPAVPDTR